MRALLVFFALIVSGCAPAALPVYIGADAPDALIEATAAAVDFWNARLGVDALELRIVANEREGYRAPFAVRVVVVDFVSDESRAYADSHVVVNRIRVERTLTDELDAAGARRALAHELGHVLGLGHAGAGNLMESGGLGVELEREQRRTVRALLAARFAAWPVSL